jgi:hypothetical protein
MFDEPEELAAFIEEHGGYWEGECKAAPLADWWQEARDNNTRLSYWEWAYTVVEQQKRN